MCPRGDIPVGAALSPLLVEPGAGPRDITNPPEKSQGSLISLVFGKHFFLSTNPPAEWVTWTPQRPPALYQEER